MSEDTTNDTQTPAAPAQAPTAPTTGPLAGAFSGLRNLFSRKESASTSKAIAPAPTNDHIAEQVEQLAIDHNTPVSAIVAMLASQGTDTEQVIASYDENKEHPIGKAVNIVVTLLCYVLPWLIAVYAGAALGESYAGRSFALFDTSAYYYLICWAYEFTLCGLMVAMVKQYKRVAARQARSIPALIAVLVLFLVLATATASAQWILFEHRINPHDQAQLIGALFRTLGTPLIDLAGAVVLAVLYSLSLEQHLETLQKKTDATIAINRKKIESRLEVVSAALQVKNELQKEADYQQKNELANTIIGMFSEHAIDAIRASLEGKRQDTGSSYRRDGYR